MRSVLPRSLSWPLFVGLVVALGLIAVSVLAGCQVANQPGLFAPPTQTALMVVHVTYTPPPTAEQPSPQPPTGIPSSPSQVSRQLEPCSPLIITSDEARMILGEPVTPAQAVSGGCAFSNTGDRLYTVSAAAGQDDQAANIMMGQAMILSLAGVQVDATQTDQLKKLASPSTPKRYFTRLVAAAQDAPSVKAHLVDGIGDGAYWAWLSGGSRPQGALAAWSGGTLVNVNVVVPSSRQQQEILNLSEDLAVKMLKRLPPRFTIGQPQAVDVAPGATLRPSPTVSTLPLPTPNEVPLTFTPRPSPSPPPPAITQTPLKPGVYAMALRADPPQPQDGQGVIFVATFLNTTGGDVYQNWCVESFRSDGKSHGITACRPARTIPAGKTELRTPDPYVGQKVGGCLPLRARVIWEDRAQRRIPFNLPDGSDLWLPYQFCP